MDFVFCTDKNYLKGYGVLMLSILRFAPPPDTEQISFHVLSDDLDDADKAILQGIASRRENTKVSFYEPEKALSEETLALIKRKSSQRFTKETYYRFLPAELLPDTVHRALYLDGDILCLGRLEDLFALDLRGCACGMRRNSKYLTMQQYNLLGYPIDGGYFNAGVMLIDLDLWRKENIARAMLDYLAANEGKPLFNDQDVINAVLHGRIFPIDFSYNVTHNHFYIYYWINEERNGYYARSTQSFPREDWPALLAACESPRLVHFTSDLKPWHRECVTPFAPVWRYFCAASPWKDERLKRYSATLPAKRRIKRLGRKALEAVHLVETKDYPYPEEAYKAAQRVLEGLRGKSLE